MNSKLRIVIILFLTSSSIAHAQLDSLAMLSSLSEGVEQTLPEPESKTKEELKENTTEGKDLTNDQYGYTGGKNF